MNWLDAIIISIVEGITEFLPISSTGHMIVVESILGTTSNEFTKAFIVNIQFGAILSVIVLYWKRFFQSIDFYYKLFIAFLPAAIIGFLIGDYIDALLDSVLTVAISLLIGGIFLLFVDKIFDSSKTENNLTYLKAFKIGLFQCIAMIPGVSRSAATIVGGLWQKLDRKTATEFSFFLAVPTMFAASVYKLFKIYKFIDTSTLSILIVGNIIAFLVAIVAIKTFINYITKYGFKVFGYYRIILGLVIIILLSLGYDLSLK